MWSTDLTCYRRFDTTTLNTLPNIHQIHQGETKFSKAFRIAPKWLITKEIRITHLSAVRTITFACYQAGLLRSADASSSITSKYCYPLLHYLKLLPSATDDFRFHPDLISIRPKSDPVVQHFCTL